MTRETPDLLKSVDLFDKALEALPDDPVLLFNAGTAAQRAELREQAKSRYQRFLTLESGTGWAVEARIRLREVESSGP
jgi:tetratricopeptide (TPR) repeat protein